jgi:hypothetical protein
VTAQARLPLLKQALHASSASLFNMLCPEDTYTFAATDSWRELLEAVLDTSQYHFLLLLQRPAATLLTPTGVLALLQAALARHAEGPVFGMQHTLSHLWAHPAAAGITPEELLPLLEAAVEQGLGVGFVQQWPPAQQLTSEQIAGLLHQALDGSSRTVRSSGSGGDVQQTTNASSEAVEDENVAVLLQCKAAAHISPDVLQALLQKCLAIRSSAAANSSSSSSSSPQAAATCPDVSGQLSSDAAAVEGLAQQLRGVTLQQLGVIVVSCSSNAQWGAESRATAHST